MIATALESEYIGFRVIGSALAPRDNLTSGPTVRFPIGRALPDSGASGAYKMPTKIREIPKETIDAFSALVDIDVEAGIVRWKNKKANRKAGAEVGSITGEGYRRTSFNNQYFYVHRFLWTYVYGSIPEGLEVDHINGDRGDNRIANLRLCSNKQNKQNTHNAPVGRTTSGLLGAMWDSRTQKWKSQIRLNLQSTFLGYFETAQEAHAEYMQAKSKFHPFSNPEYRNPNA